MMLLWWAWLGFVQPVPGLADTLLAQGEAFHAITEYKRQLFFGLGDSLQALQGIARAYEARGRWAEALAYWGEVNYRKPLPAVRHRMARLLLLQGRAREVLALLYGDSTCQGRRWRALALGYLGRYPEARDSLCALGDTLPALPSPGVIHTVAWTLPGVGFLLLGEPVRGLSSLVALAGSLLWAGYLVHQRHYSDAAAVGVSFVLRFYSGGRASVLRLYQEKQRQALRHLVETGVP